MLLCPITASQHRTVTEQLLQDCPACVRSQHWCPRAGSLSPACSGSAEGVQSQGGSTDTALSRPCLQWWLCWARSVMWTWRRRPCAISGRVTWSCCASSLDSHTHSPRAQCWAAEGAVCTWGNYSGWGGKCQSWGSVIANCCNRAQFSKLLVWACVETFKPHHVFIYRPFGIRIMFRYLGSL